MKPKEPPMYLYPAEIRERISTLNAWLNHHPHDHHMAGTVIREKDFYTNQLDKINDSGELMAAAAKTDCYNLIINNQL